MKKTPKFYVQIHLPTQSLLLISKETILKSYAISSALLGAGEQLNSYQTPRGWHQIIEKIGQGASINSVFVARKATGEIYSPELKQRHPGRDWILTRILWLGGLEAQKNLYGNCDTQQRYVYIHGTPDSTRLGRPGSRGCIRMHNQDLIELFNLVRLRTRVQILA